MQQKEKSYYLANLKHDLPAGLVVFLVAIPLCVGIAVASGAPAISGLITGIIGGLVVAWLSGSQLSVSGPAAGLTVIVLNGIEELGSLELFLLAGFLAGIIQLILGFARAGIIALYFPSSVIKGMLASIGIILIMKQFPHFLGIDEEYFGSMSFIEADGQNTISHFFNSLFNVGAGPVLIGAISFIILILWEQAFIKKIKLLNVLPGAFVAVVLSIVLNQIFVASNSIFAIGKSHLVRIPVMDSLSDVSRNLYFPDFSGIGNIEVWIIAFTIAAIASIETLLSIEAADKLDPYKRRTPTSRELKAQGVGNILAALIGGIPMTAVIVRSSANITAGGRTKVAAFFHGVLLIVSVLIFPNLLNLIPLSCLAAVLILVGFKLAKPSVIKQQWSIGKDQFIPFVTTIVAVLLTDLLIGIGIGMVVGVFFVLKSNYNHAFNYAKKEDEAKQVIEINLSEHVSFINKANIAKMLSDLPDDSKVVINGEKTIFIDYDVMEIINDFKNTAKEKNIDYQIINLEN